METANSNGLVGGNLNSSLPTVEELQALREEVDQLNSDLVEAMEQRTQAAEFGLVLLEEKKTLQGQYEDLGTLYEGTKRELDSSANALKQVQTDYEKRVKDLENQREQLLEEMETREATLMNKIDKGDEDVRQLERKLKQSVSECECLDEHNNFLNKELDRCRREIDNFKDENRRLKHDKSSTTLEMDEMKKTSDNLEKKLKQLSRLEGECQRLHSENSALSNEANSVRELYESTVVEKETIESRTQEALEALEEEREMRSILEVRLKEDSSHFHSPHPSWAVEGQVMNDDVESGQQSSRHRQFTPDSPPVSPSISDQSSANRFHSTPYNAVRSHQTAKQQPVSLLNELQESIQQTQSETHNEELEVLRKRIGELEESESVLLKEKKTLEEKLSEILAGESAQQKELVKLEALRKRISELEGAEGVLLKEKKSLEENVLETSARETAQQKELADAREEYSKGISERDILIEELQQKVVIRDEQIKHFKTKLNSATSDKASLEIELDGLNSEIKRITVASEIELDKIQKECSQELSLNAELKGKLSMFEEQLGSQVKSVEKLEAILCCSHLQVSAMTDDIKSLQKVVATLSSNGKTNGSSSVTSLKPTDNTDGNADTNGVNGTGKETEVTQEEASEEAEYIKLELRKQKSPAILVHSETSSLKAIVSLQEQLRLVRTPLETFTKGILEKSLSQTAKLISSSTSPRPYSPESLAGANRKNTLDLEASVSKWKSKYLHKAEENSNLRSIMKARATTYDVAVSSLRSKLGGQARSYQSEVTKLKYQIKMLKKERDEHLSLRNMYAKRCEDYIDEITRNKKLLERKKQEYGEVMVSLQKTIQRKLELSTELEEYRMEQERAVAIPKQLESSTV